MMTSHDDKLALASATAARDDRAARRSQDVSIVITGFMGTGKTSAGRLVADCLGRAFFDMDSIIEAREGRTVQEVFRTRGEAYFRQCETELCKELSGRKNLVIATGGGTLVDPGNRACFRDAFVVCLDATVDALFARLKNATGRPLLQGDDVRKQMTSLLSTRRAAYEQIERHVDTAAKSADQVAAEIISLFRARIDGAGNGAD